MQDSPQELPDRGQRVGAFTRIPALLRRLGADPDRVLMEAGLGADALSSPEKHMPYGAWGRLLERSAHHTKHEHFALMAGQLWHLDDLGLVGEIVRNCATVGEALECLTVHQHLNSCGGLVFMTRCAAIVDLGYAIYHPGIESPGPIHDSALAAGVNYLRELVGDAWAPSEVFLAHAKPTDTTQYRTLFKVLPRFDSELCALRFPAYWLDKPVHGADARRKQAALQRVSAVSGPELIEQVIRALRLLLLRGRSAGNDLAQMLSMHRRTLNRRLQERGTTFQHVLDDVRFEAARQFLSYSHLSLDDIAAALGYAGISPFMRTFHRWSGVTPGQWRRKAQEGIEPMPIAIGHAATVFATPGRSSATAPRATPQPDAFALDRIRKGRNRTHDRNLLRT